MPMTDKRVVTLNIPSFMAAIVPFSMAEDKIENMIMFYIGSELKVDYI